MFFDIFDNISWGYNLALVGVRIDKGSHWVPTPRNAETPEGYSPIESLRRSVSDGFPLVRCAAGGWDQENPDQNYCLEKSSVALLSLACLIIIYIQAIFGSYLLSTLHKKFN